MRLTQTGIPTNNSELDSSWTPQWASLVSYWKPNESSRSGTANEVVDSKGSNYGTAKNGVSVTTSGKLGNAASITGSSTQSIREPDAASLHVANITINYL